MLGPMVIVATSINSSVWPSGSALATATAPMLPPAPGRFSTTTGCFHISLSFWPSARASTSDVPPGANGTMMRIGLLGKAPCANAAGDIAAIATKQMLHNAVTKGVRIFMFGYSSLQQAGDRYCRSAFSDLSFPGAYCTPGSGR